MISVLDIILIVAYFIAIAVIGYLASRKESDEDYLIAGKKLGIFENITTLVATKVTASVIITYVALIYIFGISAIWTYIGTAVGYILFLFFAIKLKKEGDLNNYYSIADYFYHRYGNYTGIIITIATLCIFFLNLTIQLIGGGKILESLTNLPFTLGVIICGGVVLVYLYIGGFKAVVKTDIVQFIAIIALFIVLGVFLFSNFSYQAAQWDLMSAGPKYIIPFFIVGILFPFSAPDMWQRTLAAKSVKALKISFILTTIIYILFGFLLSLIAIIIKLKLSGIEPDTALVQGFIQLLPPGLLGAGLVALFAAIMSSADSYAFICSGLLMHDIIRNKTIRSLKYGILIIMFLGILLATTFESIINAAYLLVGFFMVLSVVIITTWIKPHVKRTTLKFGVIIGFLVTIIFACTQGVSTMSIINGLIGGLLGLSIGAIVYRIRH